MRFYSYLSFMTTIPSFFLLSENRKTLQNCSAGEPLESNCYTSPSGYNRKAAIDLKQNWSFYLDASFLYWYAQEEGLFLAQTAILTQGSLILPLKSTGIEQPFKYSPGFKVGFGTIYNQEWVIDTSYTWYETSTHTHKKAPENTSSIAGLGVWQVADWFQQTIVFSQLNSPQLESLSGTELSSTWNLKMNIFDLSGGRPFYQGSHLCISPFLGLRSAWISQQLNLGLTQAPASIGGASYLGPQPIHSHNHSSNFGIGPRALIKAHYLLPQGWRIEGSCSGSLLATWFSQLKHSEDAQSIAVPQGPYRIDDSHKFALLPNVEMGLGIGFGAYMAKNKYHIDCLAKYDFALFFEQNKMRQMLGNFWSGIGAIAGDLSLNGLTLNASLHF